MTELYIDGQPVVLPLNFSMEIIQENPFYTKNGTYTYDLTLSLRDEQNAKLYRHLNRINNQVDIPLNRSAYMVVDNEVFLKGTEVILEITDNAVKIQLLSGESELNYFIGGDRKMNSLDLGSLYGDEGGDYEYIPLYSANEDRVFNEYGLMQSNDGAIFLTGTAGSGIIAQPYLYVIINRILQNLGYSINTNVFENSKLRFLYLVNGKRTNIINKMLPDWTIGEFFEELEKLFNIAFLIEEQKRTVNIVFKNTYYESAAKVHVDLVLDSYNQRIDKERKEDYSNANIGYDFPDDEYYRYQNLSKNILDKAEYISLDSFFAIIRYITEFPNKDLLKNKIFISLESNTQYIMWEKPDSQVTLDYDYRKVNSLRPIRNNPDNEDIDVLLRILPAPMQIREINVLKQPDHPSSSPETTVLYKMMAPMPAITTDPYFERDREIGSSPTPDDIIKIQDVLENGDTYQDDDATENIYLAFYTGYHRILEKVFTKLPREVDYPIGFIDFLVDDFGLGEYSIDANNLSLRLDDPYGLKMLYEQSKPIDTTREFVCQFTYDKKIDVKRVFVFNNKEFVCKQLKYAVTPQGIDRLIEGLFYPMS
ncbi:MAG: hypothetical protein LBK58_03045 [Prevotellaceae bacterium]|jgi:hypothetical protein|nr:hypothetical protein [Prevotellaceae bacterium]